MATSLFSIADLLSDPEELSRANHHCTSSAVTHHLQPVGGYFAVLRNSHSDDRAKRPFRPSVVIDSDQSDSESDFESSSSGSSKLDGDAGYGITRLQLDVDSLSLMGDLDTEGDGHSGSGASVSGNADGSGSTDVRGSVEVNVILDHGMDSDMEDNDGVTQTDERRGEESEDDETDEPPKKKRRKLRPWKKLKRIFSPSKKNKRKKADPKQPTSMQSVDPAVEEPVLSTEQFILSSSKQGDSGTGDDKKLSQQIEKSLEDLPRPRENSDEGLPLSPETLSASPDQLQVPSRSGSPKPNRDSGIISPGEEKLFTQVDIDGPTPSLRLPRRPLSAQSDDVFETLPTVLTLNSDAARHRIAVKPAGKRPWSKYRSPQATSPEQFVFEPSPRAFASESKCSSGGGGDADIMPLIEHSIPSPCHVSVDRGSSWGRPLSGVQLPRFSRPRHYQVSAMWGVRMNAPLEEEEYDISSDSDSDSEAGSTTSSSSGTSLENSIELNESQGCGEVEITDITTMIRRWSHDYIEGIDEESQMEVKSALDTSRRRAAGEKKQLNGILDQLIEASREAYNPAVNTNGELNGVTDGGGMATENGGARTENGVVTVKGIVKEEPTPPSVETDRESKGQGGVPSEYDKPVNGNETGSPIISEKAAVVGWKHVPETGQAVKTEIHVEPVNSVEKEIANDRGREPPRPVNKVYMSTPGVTMRVKTRVPKDETGVAEDRGVEKASSPSPERSRSAYGMSTGTEKGHVNGESGAEGRPRSVRDRISRFQETTAPVPSPKPRRRVKRDSLGVVQAGPALSTAADTSAEVKTDPIGPAPVDGLQDKTGVSPIKDGQADSETGSLSVKQLTSAFAKPKAEPPTAPPVTETSPVPVPGNQQGLTSASTKEWDISKSPKNLPAPVRIAKKLPSPPRPMPRRHTSPAVSRKMNNAHKDPTPSAGNSPPSARVGESKGQSSTGSARSHDPPSDKGSPVPAPREAKSPLSAPSASRGQQVDVVTRENSPSVIASQVPGEKDMQKTSSPGVTRKEAVAATKGDHETASTKSSPVSTGRGTEESSSPLRSRKEAANVVKNSHDPPATKSSPPSEKQKKTATPVLLSSEEQNCTTGVTKTRDGDTLSAKGSPLPVRKGERSRTSSPLVARRKSTPPDRMKPMTAAVTRAHSANPPSQKKSLSPDKTDKGGSHSAGTSSERLQPAPTAVTRTQSANATTPEQQQEKATSLGKPKTSQSSAKTDEGGGHVTKMSSDRLKPTTTAVTREQPADPPSQKQQQGKTTSPGEPGMLPSSDETGKGGGHPQEKSSDRSKPTPSTPAKMQQSSPHARASAKAVTPGKWKASASPSGTEAAQKKAVPKSEEGEDRPAAHGKGGVKALIMRFQDTQQQFNAQQRTTPVVS